MALMKKEECMFKLRELGTVPPDVMAQVSGLKRRELVERKEEVSRKLKEYGYVPPLCFVFSCPARHSFCLGRCGGTARGCSRCW